MTVRPFASIAWGAALTLLAAGTAAAQETPQRIFSLELNNSHDVNGGCRLIYVAENRTDVALEKTSYEVAVFDSDQRVSQILILEFGELPIGKTKVVQFDLANQPCSQISRLLINDVAECTSAGGPVPVCMDDLKTKTLTKIDFGV